MAKSGKHTGVSFTDAELEDPLPPTTVTRVVSGGESLSAGNSSSPSGENLNSESGSRTRNPQKPVSSTGNRSSQQEEGTDSAARSAGTGGQKTAQESGRKRGTGSGSKKARVRAADEEDDEFSDFE
jgi:hypothetical protein